MFRKLRERWWQILLGLVLIMGCLPLIPVVLNPYTLLFTFIAWSYELAFVALGSFFCGLYLWRKRRWLSLSLIVLSAAYLAFFLHFIIFHPNNLPENTVMIDLRRPSDLSGIPKGAFWFSHSWPPPKTVVPLTASGSSCDMEGKVTVSVVLPDGYVLRDVGRQVAIETDDMGVWQVYIEVFGVESQSALESVKRNIWPVAMRPENNDRTAAGRSEIQDRLETFGPKSALDVGLDFRNPTYSLQLGMRNIAVWNSFTLHPSNRVLYAYTITLPHVPFFSGFRALPKATEPEQLVSDCREILKQGTAFNLPRERWPLSISQLGPSSVTVDNGSVIILFGSDTGLGAHSYAVSTGNQIANTRHLRVLSTPYLGLNEVQWHNWEN